MRAFRKRWLVLAVPALIGLAAAVLWLRPTSLTAQVSTAAPQAVATESTPDAVPVATSVARVLAANRTTAVRRGTISDTLRLFGRVVPQQETAIVAPTDGKVASLAVQIGATVSGGQLVGQLDPDVPLLGIGALADPAGLMRAPWSGAITGVQLHVGDKAQAGQTVVLLARQSDPLLRLDLTEQDAARMAVGQQATALDPAADPAAPPARLAGMLVDLTRADDGKSAVGMVELDWAGKPPHFGTVVDLNVVVQQKTDVLLVPVRAVHSLGDRHFVEYLDAGLRKTANVEVGIVSGDDVEIVQGLTEGQSVIAR